MIQGLARIGLLLSVLGMLGADAGQAQAGTLRGVVFSGEKRLRDAVVALSSGRLGDGPGSPAKAEESAGERAVMNQKNLAFRPRVLPILRGTTVEFPNQDDVAHNVFSPSSVNGPFDLGTYGGGQSRSIRLNASGEVRILCNIHMEMEGHIVVLDEPYFTVSAASGEFQIDGIPPGDYTLRVWRGRWFLDTQLVQMPDAGDVTLEVRASR